VQAECAQNRTLALVLAMALCLSVTSRCSVKRGERI